MRGPPLPLRDYQLAAVEAATKKNLICVLPTNSGKTIIAATVVERVLLRENDPRGGARRKVIFLAPTRTLAHQQASVLLTQVASLKGDAGEGPDSEDSSWRLGLIVGDKCGSHGRLSDYQVAVMTPAIFENDLNRGHVRMEDVALLVIDEAHHCRGKVKNDQYTTIMKYHYMPCDEARRPRILALTASPVENAQAQRPDEVDFQANLRELEREL